MVRGKVHSKFVFFRVTRSAISLNLRCSQEFVKTIN